MSDTLSQPVVPPAILGEFFDKDVQVDVLSGGLVNQTFLVTEREGTHRILQRLGDVLKRSVSTDYIVVTDYLDDMGWEVPHMVPTKSGDMDLYDEQGNKWRAITYIESDGAPEKRPDADDLKAYGTILGEFHNTLSGLDYEMKFVIPHFHDIQSYANKLDSLQEQLPEALSNYVQEFNHTALLAKRLGVLPAHLPAAVQNFADTLLQTHISADAVPVLSKQLIHGDPKTENMLFRAGKPFTYIDLDTFMNASTALDVGDFLRSLAENAFHAGTPMTFENIQHTVDAYRQVTLPTIDSAEFMEWSLRAMQRIALELSMRFVNDIVDNNYFGWDPKVYGSRREHNLARALIQWQIFQKYDPIKLGV